MALNSYILLTLAGATVLAVTLVVVGVQRRRRLREELDAVEPRIEDGDIERILSEGRLVKNDEPPLDLDEIAEEEERFWRSESWDAAEEW